MLRVDMLPAAQGDAIWVEYGDDAHPRRVLVDGGTSNSWSDGLRARIEAVPASERVFDLLVITHVDADHIDGALRLLRDEELGTSFGDIWFNGWRHLPDTPLESLGPVDGELLTDTIVTRNLPWNEAFGGDAVVAGPSDELPRRQLPDGLTVTVLSPQPQQLAELKPAWRKAVEVAGLDPEKAVEATEPETSDEVLETLGADQLPDVAALAASPFKSDTAQANGSSIVLLFEFAGKNIMLCGDAFPAVILSSLERLLLERGTERLKVDALKLPHHGSHANISSGLLVKLDCPRYLFSSNGAHTRHPHPEAVARSIVSAEHDSLLFFNYSTRFNEIWDDQQLQDEFDYRPIYPPEGTRGLSVLL